MAPRTKTWQKLMAVMGFLPTLNILLPLALWSFIGMMNLISASHGFLISIALFFLFASTRSIMEASYQSWGFLLLISFSISWFFCIDFLEHSFAKSWAMELVNYTPRLPYRDILRISACMVLTRLAVIFRFIDPFSIVKWCSEWYAQFVIVISPFMPYFSPVLCVSASVTPFQLYSDHWLIDAQLLMASLTSLYCKEIHLKFWSGHHFRLQEW